MRFTTESTEVAEKNGASTFGAAFPCRRRVARRNCARNTCFAAIHRTNPTGRGRGILLDRNRVRVYGNLPYYITSPILHHLFASAEIIDEINIVIQHEVALRLAAKPGTRDYGYLSVLTQYFSRPELVMDIPRDAFRPPPEVDSALVTLRLPGERRKLPQLDGTAFLEFVKLCFSQKRKTLVNNLKSQVKAELVREALADLKLRVDARAEQLSVSNLAAIFSQLHSA